ncbi:MAG: vgrG [Rhizobacter sp.]|nr:vgrG [Rhizobacter sp.]
MVTGTPGSGGGKTLAELTHPLPKQGDLLFHSLAATETLSQPFEYELALLSENENLDHDLLLGKSMTVKLELAKGERFFNGRVARFGLVGKKTGTRYYEYRAVLRPWLWFLTLNQDNRIFQEKTAVDIVKEVCNAHAALTPAIEEKHHQTLDSRDYCVQYRESDFAFVSRLLEEEGLYYYFEHTASTHKMVLCAGPSSHGAQAGYETLDYVGGARSGSKQEVVRRWTASSSVETGTVTLTDFDFEKPTLSLNKSKTTTRKQPVTGLESYDYPGAYVKPDIGTRYVGLQIEALQARQRVIDGDTDARGLVCGRTFKVKGLPATADNGEYLVIQTHIALQEGVEESEGLASQNLFACEFQAVSTREPFRAPRVTPRPLVHGPQTAIVVGPGGAEIHTDKYGRVKVQFHWDRLGANNEKSSCWVRVSHPWASKRFGMIALPRIGDEVVVSFLEGDPDKPLITGRVYNADNMPIYGLPAHATITGIKSRSSKGGGADNNNELRFEDDKGKEHVWFQAEKDFYRNVKNDAFDVVGHDETVTIGKLRKTSIGTDNTWDVGGSSNEQVGKDVHRTIGADSITSIGSVMDLTVGTHAGVSVGSNTTVAVGANLEVAVGANTGLHVGSNLDVDVGQNLAQTAGMEMSLKAGMDMLGTAGMNLMLKGGVNVVIEAGMQMTLKAGPAIITLGPAGVSIVGPMVMINSGGGGGSATPAKAAKKTDKTDPSKAVAPAKIVAWQDPLPK